MLVDDVTVMGGTLTELANHIRSNGGEVVGVVTLANASRAGLNAASPAQIKLIERRFGDEIRQQFGVEPAALTASEADYLSGFRDADALRTAVAKAERERDRRLLSKGIRPSSPERLSQGGEPIIRLTGEEVGEPYTGPSSMAALRRAAERWYRQNLRGTTTTTKDGTVVEFSRQGMKNRPA